MSILDTLKSMGGCQGGIFIYEHAKAAAYFANLGRERKELKPVTKNRLKNLFPNLDLNKVRFVINASLPADWFTDDKDAITFGYLIYFAGHDIQWTYDGLRCLIHELVHVDQLRRMGDDEAQFACKYGEGFMQAGSEAANPLANPLEIEANELENYLCDLALDTPFYIMLYPDLEVAFGFDDYKALTHYLDNGVHEGRSSSPVFDVRFYLDHHMDLQINYGPGNFAAALYHWLRYGLKEGRTSSAAFDVHTYLSHNRDLRPPAGGANPYAAAMEHWLNYGLFEGRRSSRAFDVDFYLNNNPDVKWAFGINNYLAGLRHWLQYGLNEGRKSSAAFDVNFYLNHHPDLLVTFGARNYPAALHHWLLFGIREGRPSAPNFDVRFYLDNYADLQEAFGNDYGAAIDHWLIFGVNEGRQGAP